MKTISNISISQCKWNDKLLSLMEILRWYDKYQIIHYLWDKFEKVFAAKIRTMRFRSNSRLTKQLDGLFVVTAPCKRVSKIKTVSLIERETKERQKNKENDGEEGVETWDTKPQVAHHFYLFLHLLVLSCHTYNMEKVDCF